MAPLPLYEFMARYRDEIVADAVGKMKARAPERDERQLTTEYHAFVGEIIAALEDRAETPSKPPPSLKSETAAEQGGRRQRDGDPLAGIAIELGMISDSVGEVGHRAGLEFAAGDYQGFNKCIDTAISVAIEQFTQQEEAHTTERMGFVAHELRNALSSGRMAFSAMQSGKVGVNGKTGDVLARSLGRLESLVEQMLLAVRTHSALEPEARPTRVEGLLQELKESAVVERNIQIRVEADPVLVALADSALLTSAISNLVQNAIKFTRNGGQVTLRARSDGDAIIIEVEDECGGLPPGQEHELFRPFVQASEDRRGLGLGLSITREAIEAQHGSVGVHDLPGKGCVFCVKLARVG